MDNERILLIEDNDLDARFIQEALTSVSPNLRVVRASDGQSGLEALRTEFPSMVMLDLSMPGMDGFDVLDRIRTEQCGRALPIVVCSTSDADVDVTKSYQKLANAYVVKPDTRDGYRRLAESLSGFWFEEARLP